MGPMRIERKRENVVTVTATSQELAALVAAARMARDAMRSASDAPREALEILERVIADYDRAAARMSGPPGG
jgi:hypothetical protein